MRFNHLRKIESSSLSRRARAGRWQMLAARFPELESMRVLDLGGTERSWDLATAKPLDLTIVNAPFAADFELEGNVILADACEPGLLDGEHFDLVYSNSVIEHVGGHYRRQRFAENVQRLGSHWWVQTPYRYFPIEPHYFAPVMQFLPDAARVAMASRWPLGNFTGARGDEVATAVLEIELLSRTALRYHFPSGDILSERAFGLTKSLIAAR